jgi:hypothetical protein
MKKFRNILLVSGSGRNCGKTTLCCLLINQLKKSDRVIGLKISPHFHINQQSHNIIFEGPDYTIYKETEKTSGKDSSRMLAAGAEKVYFIQCTDENLPDLYPNLKHLLPDEIPVVCESGSLANHYIPGMHILIKPIDGSSLKPSYLSNLKIADRLISANEFLLSNLNYSIIYSKDGWRMNKL